MNNLFKQKIIENALLTNSRICLPEIEDVRVLEAVNELKKIGFNIVDSQQLENNIVNYKKLVKEKFFSQNWTDEMMDSYMQSSLNLSIAALDNDDLDCVIAGASFKTSDVIRSAIRMVGVDKDKKWITSIFFMLSPCQNHFYTFADCAVIPEPNIEQLCYIAFEASKMHELIFENNPKVAFLSFSTKGSAEHYKVKKIQDAVSLFSSKFNHIDCEGELQFDAAIDKNILSKKVEKSKLNGDANIFIFPDLDSGNISYKITQCLARYQAVGPILLGLNKTVNDLSRGCTVDDIIYTAAISALQS